MKPMQFNIYKGVTGKMGAVQFNLQPPNFFCPKCKKKNFDSPTPVCDCKEEMNAREGAVFMEITSTTGPNQYDWNNKIVIALSINDLGKLLFTLKTGEEMKLMHDPNAKSANAGQVTKNLTVSSPKGLEAGVIINAYEKGPAGEKKHMVALNPTEIAVLGTLVQAAIPRCLSWA